MTGPRRWIRALALTMGSTLVLAWPAAAAQSATQQLPGVACSVTSSLVLAPGAGSMLYSGGVSCAGGVGQKTLDVVPQVFHVVNGKQLWFDITSAALYQGPTPVNPLRLTALTGAASGHEYRVLAYGRVTMPTGKTAWATACSGTCSGSPALSINPTHRYAPQPQIIVRVGASPCSLTEQGPVFTVVNGSWVMSYAGRLACAHAPVTKRLVISAQVAGSGGFAGRDFTINGSALIAGPTGRDPVALSTGRSAYLGHAYRIKASATVTYRGKTYTATAYSRSFAP